MTLTGWSSSGLWLVLFLKTENTRQIMYLSCYFCLFQDRSRKKSEIPSPCWQIFLFRVSKKNVLHFSIIISMHFTHWSLVKHKTWQFTVTHSLLNLSYNLLLLLHPSIFCHLYSLRGHSGTRLSYISLYDKVPLLFLGDPAESPINM